jgi:hypothetical protein
LEPYFSIGSKIHLEPLEDHTVRAFNLAIASRVGH